MKRYFLLTILACLSFSIQAATTKFYALGSAVPSGCEQLEEFPDGTFHFHGSLQPGDLYISTSSSLRSSTLCYMPKYEDTNIVCDAVPYTTKRGLTGTSWRVLFAADNYRFTLDPTAQTVTGEIFNFWYECWMMGGCVAADQTDDWYLEKGQQMQQDYNDPYVFTFLGLLKSYSGNVEKNRFKIVGQYGWTPKALHPFVQDAPILEQQYLCYGGSHDYKWDIDQDGYYRISVNVFRETIHAEYLGTTAPDGVGETLADAPRILVNENTIRVESPVPTTARLFAADGSFVDQSVGYSASLLAPKKGIYLLQTGDGKGAQTRKILIK